MKTDYRVNDKLIRKSLGKELPDLTISPTIKMAIMEHVNNKKSHSLSLILVWMGIVVAHGLNVCEDWACAGEVERL